MAGATLCFSGPDALSWLRSRSACCGPSGLAQRVRVQHEGAKEKDLATDHGCLLHRRLPDPENPRSFHTAKFFSTLGGSIATLRTHHQRKDASMRRTIPSLARQLALVLGLVVLGDNLGCHIAEAATPIQVYGVWHAGNDYCIWGSVRNLVEFDSKNHWLIDRGDGVPSVNLVVLSFVHPL